MYAHRRDGDGSKKRRSAESSRAAAASPRPKFEADALKLYIKTLLQTTLATATWPDGKEYPRVKGWCKEISSRVKERMISARNGLHSASALILVSELQPEGL